MENGNSDEDILMSIFDIGNTTGITEGTYIFNTGPPPANPQIIASFSTFIMDLDLKNEIILTSVEGTRIKGSFTFNMTNILGEAITINGTFNAVGITSKN